MKTCSRLAITCCLLICIGSMQGCFTPAHCAGIEHADALRREFFGLRNPPASAFSYMRANMVASPRPVVGVHVGVAQRDGLLYEEYQFSEVLVSDDRRRCLRVLLPVPAGDGRKQKAVLEELEVDGEPRGAARAWLIPQQHGVDLRTLPALARIFDSPEIDPSETVIALAVDQGTLNWMRGPASDAVIHESDFIDRTHRRERSVGEVVLRVATIPVAMAGDAALISGVIVFAPFVIFSRWIDDLGEALSSDEVTAAEAPSPPAP